jgi:hypothetical protein
MEAGQEPAQALVALLVDREVASVRELSGLVTRLLAAAQLHGRPLTPELAQRELGLTPASAPTLAPRAAMADRLDDFFLDREKIVWEWPELSGRLIEEPR